MEPRGGSLPAPHHETLEEEERVERRNGEIERGTGGSRRKRRNIVPRDTFDKEP